jgi:hypothetical protein
MTLLPLVDRSASIGSAFVQDNLFEVFRSDHAELCLLRSDEVTEQENAMPHFKLRSGVLLKAGVRAAITDNDLPGLERRCPTTR